MALIGKIRKNMWLLVVPLALGLAGFIMMDMFSGQGSMLGNNQMVMGEVDGNKINWPHFRKVEEVLYGNGGGDIFAQRSTLWNYFIEESLLNEESDAIGLGVGKDELIDLHYGANPSPIIRQRFTDPTTGQVNRQQLNTFREQLRGGQALNPNFRSYWAHQEKEVKKARLQSKLNAIVSKALYTPTWIAEMGNSEINQKVNFAYVKVPFDEVDNAEAPLENSDYQAYLNENKARFQNKEETRVLKYTSFGVFPTSQDTTDLLTEINKMVGEFRAAEDDTLFVERYQGIFSGVYFTKEQISPSMVDTVDNMAFGEVYGPFIQNNSYNAVKLVDRKMIADSADTRHILINVDPQNPASEFVVEKRIDSLMNLLETGAASFDSLALKFSEDPGSKFNGGKYENVTYGQFVPEYNDKIFLDGEIGKLYKVRSQQFGWHIVEVLSRSSSEKMRYRTATVNIPIIPSERTQSQIYDKAQEFLSKNKTLDSFVSAVNEDAELSIETPNPVDQNAYALGNLGSGQDAREMVKWAFSARDNSVSPEVYTFQDPTNTYVNKYIVATLSEIIPAGVPNVDQIKSNIEIEVMNLKKGSIIASKISGKDLSSVSSEYAVEIDTAQQVSFDQDMLPNVGREPKVIAKAYTLNVGESSEPIIGNTGVYIIKIVDKPDLLNDPNIPQLRQKISTSAKNLFSGRLIQSLKNNAKIEDNRSRFY